MKKETHTHSREEGKRGDLFLIFPILDNVARSSDQRIQTTAFNADRR